jgi:predicted XRE-type DNA-binding protein
MTAVSEAILNNGVNIEVRKDLVKALNKQIKDKGWTQAEAAQRLGVSQPRISHLSREQIDRFSVDALLKMAAAAGLRVEVNVYST